MSKTTPEEAVELITKHELFRHDGKFIERVAALIDEVVANAPLRGVDVAPVVNGDTSAYMNIRLRSVKDGLPELVDHSTSYGGQWLSKYCVVIAADGSVYPGVRLVISESVKDALDAGQKPYINWRTSMSGPRVVAWIYAADIDRMLDAHPAPSQPAAPVELPVVAWMRSNGGGSPLVTAEFIKKRPEFQDEFTEPLVKLSDAQAAIAAGRKAS